MTIAQRLVKGDGLLHRAGDGLRYELVRGELRRMSPARHKHGRMSVNITTPLDRFVREHDLGTVYAAATGFRVATDLDTVLAPDAAFVSKERVDTVRDTDGFWPGAPDLAVEVVSRHDLYTEVVEKVIDWLEAGARMVVVSWLLRTPGLLREGGWRLQPPISPQLPPHYLHPAALYYAPSKP